MRVILDVIQGPRKGRSYVIEGHDTFIVGRSRSVHCSMPEDGALSRDHFLIEMSPSRCEVRDLGSTNGTFLNDRRAERERLRSGDRITAGSSIFLVRVEGQAPTAAAPGDDLDSSSSLLEPGEMGQALRLTAEAPAVAPTLGPIRCSGCGRTAPAGLEVAGPSGPGLRESVQWLCDNCRVEAAVTPQPVPQYTTLREIGRGAMGVVYLAQHNITGQRCALKLIVPESAAARSAIDRFLREMNVVSQLKHENIVEWLEQGMTQGRFWFAMEYVDGSNLEALAVANLGKYPIPQACRMASQVLRGLEHAHALGFVHRDIKPENILIGRTPAGLMAKISDFGLAKSYRSIGLSGLTFSGEMRGTIPFMPPEQMLDFKKVQPSGDLYATAATLYYLLAGEYIYDQPEEGGGDLIRMLLEEPPVPIRQRRPEVPPELEAVLMKGLAREPADRYRDAAALRRALRPFC
jgi:serine/threonine-protein kinase